MESYCVYINDSAIHSIIYPHRCRLPHIDRVFREPCYCVVVFRPWYTPASISTHRPSTLGSPKGRIWVQTKPPTPCSRSTHQNRLAIPAHQPVASDLPVCPPFSMNVNPHPCGVFPGVGYKSGRGCVRSGFDAGMPCRPNWGNLGIWLVNISSTVDFSSNLAPVRGQVPSFRSTANTPKDDQVSK